ncbi:hypothetical protein HRR83_000599 [Exophiala dermatitidis]|uniref:Uncharacterized protein n=1 Tax=Exophiala dermatitidis TaxID=5970 RepID=A0AAN6IYZ2_EXODE|nr:hypothetical protein HRR74_000602 [Exophiala dermatitidis]KAJ4528481.1 hypothetical protein HRR73_001104 [Exophiala dermatitidis]KAJ4529849.1 hypothetical protein HRR76_009101 [Exophiala dermatitidis]KAJ4558608.1 hypothetical protein HRR77_000600 [Exophiala dermatitidis]KAJ4581359.1 hypothetical protein HRR79_000397 [Exophiala dermatitidis]
MPRAWSLYLTMITSLHDSADGMLVAHHKCPSCSCDIATASPGVARHLAAALSSGHHPLPWSILGEVVPVIGPSAPPTPGPPGRAVKSQTRQATKGKGGIQVSGALFFRKPPERSLHAEPLGR